MPDVLTEYHELEERILITMREGRGEMHCETLMLDVHGFQRRWNQPYANVCNTRPAPTSWREIPAVPQSAFKRATLSCVPRPLIGKTFLTSGTTGEKRGQHYFHNTRLYDKAVRHGWGRLGLA